MRIIACLALLSIAASAQYRGRSGVRYMDEGQTFRVRRTNDFSQDRRDGRCTIRVRIDDEADVELRGETIRVHVIKGGPGRDEGSECNAPLPTSGNITNFRFRGIDGRGTPRLAQEPASRNSYVAVVNVQDPRGGSEGFTFELTWNWDGRNSGSGSGTGGDGGFFPGPGGNNSGGGNSGGFFPGGPSGLPDMNTSAMGSGELYDGTSRYQLQEIRVQIRNGSCSIRLTTSSNQTVEMNGSTVSGQNECQLNNATNGRLNGRARFQMDGNRLRSVQLNGTLNGRGFNGSFQPR